MIANGLRNPRSEVWNLEVDRQATRDFFVHVGYYLNFFLDSIAYGSKGNLPLSDRGGDSHKESQISGGIASAVARSMRPPWIREPTAI